MQSNNSSYDIKTLVLKRWDAMGSRRIFENESYMRGDYVSFQSHHFIDILSPESDESLLGAYLSFKNLREKSSVSQDNKRNCNKIKEDGVHIVQSMTLVGGEKEFWSDPAKMMYITFIQINKTDIDDYEIIYNEVQKYFEKLETNIACVDKPKWTLYYSYDF